MALDESRLTHTTIAHKQQLELRHVGIRRRNLRLHTQGTRTFSKITVARATGFTCPAL